MKLKKEYLILIVIIIALVLYLTTRSANHDSEIPQLTKLDSAKINRLVVTVKEGTPVELVKKDELWFIEPKGYKADNVKVKNMVNALADMTLTALVSEAKSYDRYGLTPAEKIVVQAYSEGKLVRTIEIGKAAPTFQHTFVLIEGDPNVYHARGQIESKFDQTIENLRDKTIFDVNKDGITEIAFSKGGQSQTLVKKEIPREPAKEEKKAEGTETGQETPAVVEPPEIQWQKPDGEVVSKDVLDRLIGSIAKLNCDGYLEDEDPAKLGDAVWTVTYKVGAEAYTLSGFAAPDQESGDRKAEDEKPDNLPCSASTIPYPFYLSKWRVEKFEKSINELLGIEEKKEAPAAPEKAAMPEPAKSARKAK